MKYTGVTLQPDPHHADLEKVKAEPLGVILSTFADLRDQRDMLRTAKSEAEKAYDFMARHVIPDAMEEAGLVGEDGKASASTPGGGKVYLQHDVEVLLAAGDRPEAYAALASMGYDELIQDYVFPGQLKSLIKSLIEEGVAVPPGVKAEPLVKAVLRK